MKTIKNRKITLISTVALALGATLLLGSNAQAAEKRTNLNRTDARFIQDEAAVGTAMVKMAQLAEKKAQHMDVRAFAGTLAAEHTKANAELATLAGNKSVDLTSEPTDKFTDIQEKLEGTSGIEFDKVFLSNIISSHEKCVKNFKDASTDSQDSDVKAWAAKMHPGLQAHLAKAKELSSVVNANEAQSSKNTVTQNDSSARLTSDREQNRASSLDQEKNRADIYAKAEMPKNSDTEADNTARNSRDRDQSSLTPIDQGNSKADIDTTAQIRGTIIDRKELSVNAQNVKIITNEGQVTLRGPVDSSDEKRIIGEIANGVATSERTDNQLEVRSVASAK